MSLEKAPQLHQLRTVLEETFSFYKKKKCAWLFQLYPSHTVIPARAGVHQEAAHTWLSAGGVEGRSGSRLQHAGFADLFRTNQSWVSTTVRNNHLILHGHLRSVTLLTA